LVKRLIVCADDFGRDVAINRAVEDASGHGILTCASLMVGAPAAADAIERARRVPNLRVGLHVTLTDSTPLLPGSPLARQDGQFDADPRRVGIRYFFQPGIRRALAEEIRAQFEAFRATGLPLDHVNAHQHLHLHPTIARLIVQIGCDFGMRAMRLPDEPVEPLRRAFPQERFRVPAYNFTAKALRRRLRRAEIVRNDYMFGLAWSGGMGEERVLALLPHLPDGISEMYFHPAVERTRELEVAMPGYRGRDEFAALTSPAVRRRIDELGITLVSYSDLTPSA
jgi:hopanoid biosynthesis associated protein HpnK